MRIDPTIKSALEAQARRENRSTAFVLQQAASDYLARQARMSDMVSELEKIVSPGVV